MRGLRSFNPALEKHFSVPLPKFQYSFKHLAKPAPCQSIIDKLQLNTKYPDGSKLDIIDVFSGYGLFSTMVNYELKPRNHVIVENIKANVGLWREKLQILEEATKNAENFRLFNRDGYNWDTYDDLINKDKLIQPKFQPRDKIHDELLIIGNLSPSKYESLIAQWIMCCAYNNWLQKYGRVRMLCFAPSATVKKFMSGPSFGKRNKSSVKRELFTDSKLIAITETEDIVESDGAGYDPRLLFSDQPVFVSRSDTLPVNSDFALMEIEPLQVSPSPTIDEHEHLMQNLFYSPSKKLIDQLPYVGPGALDDLAPELPQEILERTIKQLTRSDWERIFHVYDNWPFKPNLMDQMDFIQEDSRSF
ncbi:S-adenosyl-L-methionine-dependent methyltransferase [Scheffersomyces xylosifermentans]|uniref:S-adenosyl-L-methionine-dependent methyltransferase n=1 Tax=Scheffersomyces xylosifermentans TaxID=1304137 RepID=UPI00315CD0B4